MFVSLPISRPSSGSNVPSFGLFYHHRQGIMMSNTCRLLAPRVIAPAMSLGSHKTAISVRQFSIITPDPGYNNNTVGPWPRTREERERAAKKYNLIPEDYEPYEEGEALGDYPKLPAIGSFNRDPYDDYDDPFAMKHYGEPYHLHYDLYQWERIDPLKHEKRDVPVWKKFIILFGSFFGLGLFIWTTSEYDININHNFKQRMMYPDQKYYTFQPSKNDHVHHIKVF